MKHEVYTEGNDFFRRHGLLATPFFIVIQKLEFCGFRGNGFKKGVRLFPKQGGEEIAFR